ncbi:hypothetical protein [Teredinibacter sp. KSP-S5-2]|nr:hypothetical protein [Teredinibacter sp. KSP-S5-2]WNO08268.1 hypothetical protein P5V12_14955 [Teredinibacter sp. KSP-S5-2]
MSFPVLAMLGICSVSRAADDVNNNTLYLLDAELDAKGEATILMR